MVGCKDKQRLGHSLRSKILMAKKPLEGSRAEIAASWTDPSLFTWPNTEGREHYHYITQPERYAAPKQNAICTKKERQNKIRCFFRHFSPKETVSLCAVPHVGTAHSLCKHLDWHISILALAFYLSSATSISCSSSVFQYSQHLPSCSNPLISSHSFVLTLSHSFHVGRTPISNNLAPISNLTNLIGRNNVGVTMTID